LINQSKFIYLIYQVYIDYLVRIIRAQDISPIKTHIRMTDFIISYCCLNSGK
jgi:hypothetical protein